MRPPESKRRISRKISAAAANSTAAEAALPAVQVAAAQPPPQLVSESQEKNHGEPRKPTRPCEGLCTRPCTKLRAIVALPRRVAGKSAGVSGTERDWCVI